MTTINRVAFLGDYMPRQCGIATFTADICEAVAAEYPNCECIVGAVNDRPEGYDYSTRIRFEIDEKEVYGVSPEKIDLIPHGVPDVQFIDPTFHKDQFGVEGKTVLLTFGLLSPNKGIEYVIEALPAILKEHPNVVYIVLGATHPNLLLREGESYRLKLERLAEDRGVTGNVIFYNRFVTLQELTDFIGAADIYVTPYLNEAQITSGTLAYAFGAGKAVISTRYLYAQELLAEERGILVPFRDSNAIAEGVTR